MAYTKQTWVDNDATKPLSAARMNYIENGIEAAHALNSPTVSVLNVKDYGAVGDGVADDRAAIQSCINIAEDRTQKGKPALVQLMRRHAVGSPGLSITHGGWILQGYGAPTGTVITPHSSYTTGWLIVVQSNDRGGEKTATKSIAGSGTYNPDNDRSGLVMRNFSVSGIDDTRVMNGIRVLRADDLRMDNIEAVMLKGIGIQLGDCDGVSGGVGSVRESHFRNIRVMMCGDGPNVPAIQIGSAPTGTSDGTNQLYFHGLDSVYNRGGVHIVNHNSGETVRRIQINQMQNHGLSHNQTVGNVTDYDLIKIEGGVNDIYLQAVITNSSGPNNAVVRTVASSTSGRFPRHIGLSRLQCSSADGDVVVIEKCANFSLVDSSPSLSDVAGAAVRVLTGSELSSYLIMGTQSSTTDYSSKFVIASDVVARGQIIWPPWAMASGGGAAASPYMAYVVRDPLPTRSTITSDSSRPIFVISDTNPYTSGLGYISGVDVWLDPQ